MKKDITTKEVFSYIWSILKPFPIPIFTMIFVAFLCAIDFSLRPYLLKEILNRFSAAPPEAIFDYLAPPTALYLIIYLLMTTTYRLYGYFVEVKMIPNLRKKIATESVGLLVEKSHNYYQNNLSGSLTNKVNDLINNIPELLLIIIDRFLNNALTLSIAVFTLWQVNSLFALFLLAWTSTFIIGAMLFSKYLGNLADNWAEYGSIMTGRIVDILTNILSIRLFAAKAQEKESFSDAFQESVESEQKLQWAYFWVWAFYGYSFFILQAANFYFLFKGRQEGWVTIGDFALVLAINTAIVDFLWQVAKEFSQFSKLLSRISQALKSIVEVPDIQDAPDAYNLVVHKGEIEFDNVRFHYKGSHPLFNKESVTIKAGQKVGLVGYSGSGKTTFINLILRLYDINEGHILIDGQDIREVTQDSLRSAIATIPQDPSLFNRTIMENIRYARVEATDAEVVEAAKRAHAHEFICKMSEGYHSMVGERGSKLSGGQKQRIAIARAILKNSPILILDEATSQLDTLTESDIQDSLWTLMQGKTTLVIAHRLSTLLHMDRILVFEHGKIVEDGTHSQLLAKGGLYKTLWTAQVGGVLPEKKFLRVVS